MTNDVQRPPSLDLPTVHGEFIGWRSWNVVRAGNIYRLQSLGTGRPHYGCLWRPGKMMQALCDRNFKGDAGTECAKGTDGRAPGEDCTCGFYSAASSDTFMDMPYAYYGSTNVYGGDKMNGKVARIYGRVALAGKVIPGSQGWRSQYAWPVELYVPYEHTALVDILHDTYHVPVKLQNWQNPLHPNDGEE